MMIFVHLILHTVPCSTSTNSPLNDLEFENESLRDVINQLRQSLQSIDGEIELYKTHLKDKDKRIEDGMRYEENVSLHDMSFIGDVSYIGGWIYWKWHC